MRADAAVVGGLPARLLRLASDQRLVEYVRAGSDRAFEALFDRHYRSVVDFCMHMLGSREEAEDAAQQTFLAAYRDLVRSAEPVAVRPWLWGIARHRCLMALRSRHERPVAEVPERVGTYDLAADVGLRDEVRTMLADVARLPSEQRAALVLAEFRDLSHEDIARVLGCPRKRVKALVFQARASLGAARDARETPCAEIREQLSTLRGPALRSAMLRRHLDGCPGCRAYRDAMHNRRGRLGARLPWGPAIALKRAVVGAVSQSGGGAGCAALTGSSLGGAAAALVVATIPLSGGAAPVTAAHDEPVRAVPVTVAARPPESGAPRRLTQNRDVPGAARAGGDERGRTDRERGAIEAGERPAPQEMEAADDRGGDEQLAPQEIVAEDDRNGGDQLVPQKEVVVRDDRQAGERSAPQEVGAGADRQRVVEQPAPQTTLVRDDRRAGEQPAPQATVARSDRRAGEQPAPQATVVRGDRRAGEQPAPQATVAENHRQASGGHGADNGDEARAPGPYQPVAARSSRSALRTSPPTPGADDERLPETRVHGPEAGRTSGPVPPVRTSRGARPAAQPGRGDERPEPGLRPPGGDERPGPAVRPGRGDGRPEPGVRPGRADVRPDPAVQPPGADERPGPAAPLRRADEHPQSAMPSRPESGTEPSRRAADPDTPPAPSSPSTAAPPASAQRPAGKADARGGSSAAAPGPPDSLTPTESR